MSEQGQTRVRAKICGITRPEDGIAAYEAGADAIGLVFYAPSPRAIDIQQAIIITQSLPPFINVVGLFVDADPGFIREVLSDVNIDTLQFHGAESNADCIAYDKPFIKAVRVKTGIDLYAIAGDYPDTIGLLLDSYVAGVQGGTGTRFNWDLIPAQLPKPWILAGGLSPENVGQAIHQTGATMVDVSGGVEHKKGLKDSHKIDRFMHEVRHASK